MHLSQLSGKTRPSHTNPPRGSKHLRLLPIDQVPWSGHAICVAVQNTVHVSRIIETRNRMQDCQPSSFTVACSAADQFFPRTPINPEELNRAAIRRSAFRPLQPFLNRVAPQQIMLLDPAHHRRLPAETSRAFATYKVHANRPSHISRQHLHTTMADQYSLHHNSLPDIT